MKEQLIVRYEINQHVYCFRRVNKIFYYKLLEQINGIKLILEKRKSIKMAQKKSVKFKYHNKISIQIDQISISIDYRLKFISKYLFSTTLPPMHKQQQPPTAQAIIIPFSQIQKYRKFMNIPSKPFDYIEYRECLENKPKTVYGAYSSESLIKLLRSIEDNSEEFMEILAINTTLSKHNKKQFLVDRLLREYCEFSFEEMLNELHFIRDQLRDKEMYEEMFQFIKLIISKAKYLLYKYCQILVMVLGECLNFYIRRRKDRRDEWQYSLVIGMDRVCVSFCSSNEYCENILHAMITKLRDQCIIDGYHFDQKELQSSNIQASGCNTFESSELPQHFLELYSKKETLIDEKTHNLPNAEVLYTTLVLNTLTKYAEDIYFIVEGTIVFLANLVLEKKQLKTITYDEQYISMHHPLDRQKTVTETFMNLYCQHFEGLPQQLYKNGEKCPYCSQLIIVDEIKCFQRNRNIFQVLMARNYLNPKGDDIVYYFRDKVFTLANRQRFSSYAHFCQFIKKHYFIRDRPEVLMLLEHEKISLYSKVWGKKKLFTEQQFIQTPVRGKYCRHLQFFELMRVYEKYITRQPEQISFECFLCFEQIEYTELIYLHEIKLLIDLAKHNFYTHQGCELNTYLQVDHTNETVELCCEMEKGHMKKEHPLAIYDTLMDPLTKSAKPERKEKKDKINQEDEFELADEFSNFFFGY